MPDVWWYEKRACWCADVPHPTEKGRRQRLYLGPDKRDAQRRLHEALARYYSIDELPDGRPTAALYSLAKLVAVFSQWGETNLAACTVERYMYALRSFVEKHAATVAAEIQPTEVEQHKARLKASGVSPRTVNFFVQAIKRLYTWAVEQGLMEDSPVRHVKRVPKAPSKDRSLSGEEVDTFLKYAGECQPLGHVCETLLNTGMRVGELLRLRWSDIDFGQCLARIYDHKTAHRGDQKPRTIPLCGRVLEIIRAQSQVSGFVFTGENGQPLTNNALKCRKDRLEKKHPDMPHVTFHQFRHTFATRCARAGVPERIAQEILGHASKLTTRYYTSTSRDELLDAVGRVSSGSGDGPE